MRPFINKYPAASLINFLMDIGIDTYVGSSGKIFPVKGIKPIQVLKAIQNRMEESGVKILTRAQWLTTEGVTVSVMHDGDKKEMISDIVVYAMGGASWSKTGSDGKWLSMFQKMGVDTIPFSPSNAGIKINWKRSFLNKWSGAPIKNIELTCGRQIFKGEILITDYGMEGPPVYAINHCLRNKENSGRFQINLIPGISEKQYHRAIQALKTSRSTSTILRSVLNLSPVKMDLIRDLLSKDQYQDRGKILSHLKDLALQSHGFAPIDEAISTVGGVSIDSVDENLKIKGKNEHYIIGEMLDWDAPTGGYLLQASYSMAAFLAEHLKNTHKNKRLLPI